MSLFARAGQGLSLSPAERALLRLIKSFLLTGLLAILPSLYQLEQDALSGTGTLTVDWQHQLVWLLLAFLVATAHAVAKYFSAQGDDPLATAITTAADDMAKRAGVPTQPVPLLPSVTASIPMPASPSVATLQPPIISATMTAAPASTTASVAPPPDVPTDATSAT